MEDRRRARTDEEHCRWISEEDENSMDVVRADPRVSDSGEKVSVSLTASAGMNDESCAGGWGAMIDIGGAMSVIVDDCIMLFS